MKRNPGIEKQKVQGPWEEVCLVCSKKSKESSVVISEGKHGEITKGEGGRTRVHKEKPFRKRMPLSSKEMMGLKQVGRCDR